MRPNDLERFCEILNGLAALKPGKELTREAIKLFWSSMQSWSIDEFAQAANHLVASVEFMPSPFHFEQLRKASKPTAAEAWQTALKRCLDWRKPRETDDVIDRAVAGIGGYRAIAMADTETSLPHFQHKFAAAYAELDGVVEVREALPHLKPAPGLNARDGKFTGITAPVLGREIVPAKRVAQ